MENGEERKRTGTGCEVESGGVETGLGDVVGDLTEGPSKTEVVPEFRLIYRGVTGSVFQVRGSDRGFFETRVGYVGKPQKTKYTKQNETKPKNRNPQIYSRTRQ